MVEVYHWEDDPEAEDLLDELQQKSLEFRSHLLDAEVPNATPYVEYQGKTYWSFQDFRDALKM